MNGSTIDVKKRSRSGLYRANELYVALRFIRS